MARDEKRTRTLPVRISVPSWKQRARRKKWLPICTNWVLDNSAITCTFTQDKSSYVAGDPPHTADEEEDGEHRPRSCKDLKYGRNWHHCNGSEQNRLPSKPGAGSLIGANVLLNCYFFFLVMFMHLKISVLFYFNIVLIPSNGEAHRKLPQRSQLLLHDLARGRQWLVVLWLGDLVLDQSEEHMVPWDTI